MKTLRALALVPASMLLLSLAACDEADELSLGDVVERRPGGLVVYQVAVKKGFKGDIEPGPGCGGDDGPAGGGPWFDVLVDNADAVYASAWQDSLDAELFCPDACEEHGARWSGDVTARGEYTVGEVEWSEDARGNLSASADITGRVAMGCMCE